MLGSLLFLLFVYMATTDGGHPRRYHRGEENDVQRGWREWMIKEGYGQDRTSRND